MRYSKLLANSILLCTTPVSITYPESGILQAGIHIPNDTPSDLGIGRCAVLNDPLFSYDDVLNLLEEIESGEAEYLYSTSEIDRINHFVAFLAQQGVLPGDIDQAIAVNQGIENLLCSNENPCVFFYSINDEYSIAPSIFYGRSDPILCRNWFKKQWDQTREFIKKHKKAIIIGTVVVIPLVIEETV